MINCQNKSKETWSVLNEMLCRNRKGNIVKKIVVDEAVYTESKDTANCFNNYFINVGPNLVNNIKKLMRLALNI